MRRLFVAGVLMAAVAAYAADDPAKPTPASKPPAPDAQGGGKKKLGSFKEFGQELGKLGKNIGKGAVDAGKAAGAKVSKDVKEKNFKPDPKAAPTEPSPRDRGGTR